MLLKRTMFMETWMEKELLINVHSALKLPRRISSECIHRLFHYTNYKSKAEIVGDKNIVFKPSRVDKFLDKNEGIQILEPYYHACGDLYESGVIDKNFFLILKEIKEEDLLARFSNTWVLSFSKNANSTFMKRRYAAGDGWILGIPFDLLDYVCIDFPEKSGIIDLYEVEYSFDKVFLFIKESLSEYYEIYKSNSNYSCDSENIIKDIVAWLGAQSLVYKSPIYKQEEEIRLVCKFAPGFTSYKSRKHNVEFKSSIDGYNAVMEIIFDKKYLTYESQNLNDCFDVKLNKTILARDEI